MHSLKKTPLIDQGNIQKAITQAANSTWQQRWPGVWYKLVTKNGLPVPAEVEDRATAVDSCQCELAIGAGRHNTSVGSAVA